MRRTEEITKSALMAQSCVQLRIFSEKRSLSNAAVQKDDINDILRLQGERKETARSTARGFYQMSKGNIFPIERTKYIG